MTARVPTRLELQLPRTPATPAIARRRLVERFAADLDNRALQDAELLTSELVTNAVLHGRGPIELTVLLDETHLTVDVTDHGNGFERPAREPRGLDAVGGQGLNIVDALANRWGIQPGRSRVWFELERHLPRLRAADQSVA
ncbi:MAG TPA: ATP-binding protein [Solirubrobacteraceae bacterium]|nr:ATP-binding protein [Solirubrobacteraceae bacterium]